MHRSASRATLVLSFAATFIAAASSAQTPSPCDVTGGGLMIYSSYAKTNPPFSATIRTTHEQKLADGNSIHGEIVTHEYRDAVRRLRSEFAMPCELGPDGRYHSPIEVSVHDPVAGTIMHWQIDGNRDKVVRILHDADQKAASLAAPPPTEEQRKLNIMMNQRWRQNTRHEQLGTRMIAGVLTDGSRQITTIPAGQQGNAQPLEQSTEVWIAEDTGIAMLRIEDSPAGGRTTTEVTDLKIGEPDSSAFTPPSSYKMVEQATPGPAIQ